MGDVDNISQIKEGLGTTTVGLGIAFDTTLLGLFFAIITGFSTILQRMESSGLDLMERTALDVLKTVSAIDVPLATERTADHMTSATVELRQALADLREYVADLKNIADEQRENLSEERRALQMKPSMQRVEGAVNTTFGRWFFQPCNSIRSTIIFLKAVTTSPRPWVVMCNYSV